MLIQDDRKVLNRGPSAYRVVEGDLALPFGGDYRIVLHFCGPGHSWVTPTSRRLAERWPKLYTFYRHWVKNQGYNDYGPGQILPLTIGRKLAVINCMVSGTGLQPGLVPSWLDEALPKANLWLQGEFPDRRLNVHAQDCDEISPGRYSRERLADFFQRDTRVYLYRQAAAEASEYYLLVDGKYKLYVDYLRARGFHWYPEPKCWLRAKDASPAEWEQLCRTLDSDVHLRRVPKNMLSSVRDYGE